MDKLQAHYRQIADEEYPECEGCKRLRAENARLRAALFCEYPGCDGKGFIERKGSLNRGLEKVRLTFIDPCPTCGPLRAELCKTQGEGE